MTKKQKRSPLRYPGGKSKALKQILPLLPKFKEYREPFLGGGSVFVSLLQSNPDCTFWVNDLYEELYCFWLEMKQNPSAVIDLVRKWKAENSDGKKLYLHLFKNIQNFTSLEKAAAFFVLNRITFSGTTVSGGFSKQAFESRFTESSILRAEQLGAILKGDIQMTNVDYSELVLAEGEDVFLFLDPPYYEASKTGLYGKNGSMNRTFDHQEFATTMRKCPHKWLMTYDNTPYIRELFADFADIYEWEFAYGMRNVTKDADLVGKEIFIVSRS